MNRDKRQMSASTATLIALGALVAGIALIRRASRLPQRSAPPDADALPDTGDTPLARAASAQAMRHPDRSGVHLLSDGLDAFAARLLLVRAAQHTLDLQYYIWHGDRTGTLMLEAVHAAADRGVRVRLLLDDNGIAGLDRVLAALDAHPNVEVRLFNPFRIRFPKALGFVADFARLNRRMHNKSFTADRAVTIVGGRNIGDEYFGAGDGALFADLDVLAIGPAVAAVTTDFERYWTCESAYSAANILPPARPRQLDRLARRSSIVARDPSAARYVERLATLPLIHEMLGGTLELEWAPVRILSDDPAKVLDKVADSDLLAPRLEQAIGPITRELGIVAGYFVPGPDAAAQLAALARSGVGVSVLTNGYAANDVALVHAGYAPCRRALLEAGVSLYEMGPAERDATSRGERRRGTRLGVGSRLRGTGTGSTAALRSGASTLHAKTFTVDRERLFVGSFNFDPRSIRLNTELGFVMDSPVLATRVANALDTLAPAQSWKVELDGDDRLRWHRDGAERRREPDMRLLDRALIAVASRLPIAWLL